MNIAPPPIIDLPAPLSQQEGRGSSGVVARGSSITVQIIIINSHVRRFYILRFFTFIL